MSDNIRYEISHEGKMVQAPTSLSKKLNELVAALFNQQGWSYHEESVHGPYHKAVIKSPLGESYPVNLFTANIRNEKRSPYEKKIQLSKEDPRQYKGEITLILGFYVFQEDDDIQDAIIVGYPVDEAINYDTNPSLRGVFVNDVLLKAKVNGVCIDRERKLVGFRPEFVFFYLMNYTNIHGYANGQYTAAYSGHIDISNNDIEFEQNRVDKGRNILLYGVPGSGKSWTIEHEYCPPESKVERLVFHPDYTSSDFIGQILPVVDKENENQVTYEFTPGPFTTILRDAYTHPQQEYILIIEEINRGNAPAIFGEVFQLLDRMVANKTINGIEYHAGTSEYEITNKNIADIVYNDETHKIRIPSNLSILATMNTSDQNVFTLDTAFQRRWKMRLIENSFENVRPSLAECPILDTEVSWQRFCETINKQIVGNKAKMASSEDKRLGVYFVHENDLKYDDADKPVNHDTLRAELNELLKAEREGAITGEQQNRLKAIRAALMQNRIFPEKVIKYLWDDAFKFNPGAIFDTEENKELDSLEAVIRLFVYDNRGRDRFRIFNRQVRELLYEA